MGDAVSERWATVERLYHEALARDPQERAAFLSEACAGDDALRREVESLLDHDGSAAFLSTPAAVQAGQITLSGSSLIGQSVGPYVIAARLGAGGMGEVYRARDQKLGRDVAIKILPPAFTSDPERLARFAREARVLAALNHPHIGAIYGLEDAGPMRALVLELVDGPTLADRIARGRIPVAEALTIARQIAEALEAAHEKGIVHRDLKPANVKLTRDGVVKVLDFGLAKAGVGDGVTSDLTHSPTVTIGGTREGLLLGTAAYMSPEQARGQAVDKRTDIWAFGCVVYEMLTGCAAFSGSTVSDTLAAILDREPDWTLLPNATAAAIHRLLRRCLEKDSKLRLRDIADVRIEIDEALRPGPTDQTTKHGWPKKWIAAAVTLVVVLGMGAWAVSRFRQPDAGGPVLRLQIAPPDGGQFGGIGDPFVRRGPGLALSPDGTAAVYGATVSGQYALWLRPLDGTAARVLRGTEDARFPFWSPDGRSIAFFANGKLQKLDVAGGPPFVICDVPQVFGGVWAPDGRILVGIFGGAIASVPASGGTLSAVTTLDRSKGDVAHVWPQVLPGGHFLYWGGSTKPEDNGVIYAASFEKPNERVRLITSETSAVYTSGPDGRGYLLWQRGGTLIAQEFDGTTFKFAGEPRPIADAIGMVGSAAFIAVAAASNGSLLYANAALQQLTWFDRVGKQLGTLGDPGQFSPLRFSPDGKQIATTRVEATRELVLLEVDRAMSRRGTFDSRGGFSPLWSPDGRTILFIGDSVTALYRKDATGTAPDQRLASWRPQDACLCDWSRDGRSVLNIRSTVETGADIWVVPVTPDGHLAADAQPKPYLRTPVNESAGRFLPEPNPRWVAYQSDESGHDEVYVQSFPEPHGPHRISTNGGTAPQWGPGGRELFYQSSDGKVMAASLKLGADSIEASAPRELFAIPRESFFEVAPDGQRFLVNMPAPTPHPLNVIVNWPSLLKSTVTGQ
jgi:hypothetical protein